jgi:glycosyltransferase involved in cell wall biosynthesis
MNWIILLLQGINLKILVLEPYYGGSHKTFLDGLQAHVPVDFILMTLPAGRWKWRMRLAAPFFADKIKALCKDIMFDAVFCSSFVDVATLRSLLPTPLSQLPFYTYFHENQFAYPTRKEDERDLHFGLTNLTTVMASDRVAFSSRYNMQTFMTGVEQILRMCPDMKFAGVLEKINDKASIIHPGIDFSQIDTAVQSRRKGTGIPVIVWNHRWEHDKNPKCFFETIFALEANGSDFRLIILGQSFRKIPVIFAAALDKLRHKILHCGFVESRDEYARLLALGNIVVSTAKHEFYGISVIEAVRAGCIPVLPNSLSYPELFPAQYLYAKGDLPSKLTAILSDPGKIDELQTKVLTDRFSWLTLKERYFDWFSDPRLSS